MDERNFKSVVSSVVTSTRGEGEEEDEAGRVELKRERKGVTAERYSVMGGVQFSCWGHQDCATNEESATSRKCIAENSEDRQGSRLGASAPSPKGARRLLRASRRQRTGQYPKWRE